MINRLELQCLHREQGYGIIPYIIESFCIITPGSFFYRRVLYKYMLGGKFQMQGGYNDN